MGRIDRFLATIEPQEDGETWELLFKDKQISKSQAPLSQYEQEMPNSIMEELAKFVDAPNVVFFEGVCWQKLRELVEQATLEEQQEEERLKSRRVSLSFGTKPQFLPLFEKYGKQKKPSSETPFFHKNMLPWHTYLSSRQNPCFSPPEEQQKTPVHEDSSVSHKHPKTHHILTRQGYVTF